MPLVLSIALSASPPEIRATHRAYAERRGYTLAEYEATHIRAERMRTAWKYHLLAHHLRGLPPGDCLMLLTDEAVVLGGMDLDAVIGSAEAFVAARIDDAALPNTAMLVLRHTETCLGFVDRLLSAISEWLDCTTSLSLQTEAEALARVAREYGLLLWPTLHALPNGVFPNVHCNARLISTLELEGKAVLVASEPEFLLRVDEAWRSSPLNDWHVLSHLAHGDHLGAGRAIAEEACPEPVLVHDAGASFLIVSLHTPNIRASARIHEESLLAYAKRHGYGFVSYRDAPGFLPAGIGPSWSKPFVVRHHLDDHDHVAWIDADTLIVDPAIALAEVAGSREFLAARDHSFCYFNSGLMVFRNTPAVVALLEEVMREIAAARVDPDNVYAAGGDQSFFNNAAARLGLVTPETIFDSVSFNPRPPFATPASFMVHFSEYLRDTRAPAMRRYAESLALPAAPVKRRRRRAE